MAKVFGVPGNTGYYGATGSNEYLNELSGQAGRIIFNEMRRSDSQIKALLKAISLPIQRANYYIDPASDSAKDREIAEFLEKNLLEGGMTITWKDVLSHILLMDPFGFSILEPVYEIREDQKVHLRKLDPRLPQSISEWDFDKQNGNLENVIQHDVDGKKYVLPIQNIVIFTNEKEGANWEGTSILRPAYKAWYIKDNLEKIQTISLERFGMGVPVGKEPENPTQANREAFETALENIAANETSRIVLPNGYEVDLLSGGAKAAPDILATIKYYDEMIARSALAQFMVLGSTATGSRALGDSFQAFFLMSLEEKAEYICETLSRFVIRKLVSYNWNVSEFPHLKVRSIQELDVKTIAELKKAGIITHDMDLENSLREVLHLPEVSEEVIEERKKIAESLKQKSEDTDPEDVEEEEEEKSDPKTVKASCTCHRGGVTFSREPKEYEQILNLSEIQGTLDSSSTSLFDQVIDIRSKQIEKIVLHIAGGKRIRDIAVPNKKEMFDACLKAYKSAFKEGKIQVRDEIQRQRKDLSFADPVEVYEDYFDIIEEEISLKVEGAGDKLKSQVGTLALELKKKGLEGDELTNELWAKIDDTVRDTTWKELTNTSVNGGWGAGRRIGAEPFRDDIQDCYYSAILDKNACNQCFPKDGHSHEYNNPEYITPNPLCKGGGACRCLTVYVMKQEAEA